MTRLHEIRADFDRHTITMYQAYDDAIAEAALAAQRFEPPFSMHRMTWIKPSFLWLMHRSQWAQKKNQTRILAIKISREGFEEALRAAVLTEFVPSIHPGREAWRDSFEQAPVHVQWDTERSLHGKALDHYSIQVGVGRALISSYVEQWTESIEDYTSIAMKLHAASRSGNSKQASRLLPKARIYPVSASLGAHLLLC